MERRFGVEPCESFDEAIALEPARLAPELARLSGDDTYVSPLHQTYSYLSRGLYAEQIAHWLRYFPREQFLFHESEQLFSRPRAVADSVCDFLGIRRFDDVDFPRRNPGAYPAMPPRTRRALRQFFHWPNRALSRFCGWEPSWCRASTEHSEFEFTECSS
jgi:hypothetical protein